MSIEKTAFEQRFKESEEVSPVLFDEEHNRKGFWLILLVPLGKQQGGHCGWSRDWAGTERQGRGRSSRILRLLEGLQCVFSFLIILAALSLHCFFASLLHCFIAFSSRGKWGMLSSCCARAAHCSHFSGCREPALVHGLSCGAQAEIFLDQGLNPCPLHWQVDS